MRWEFPKDPGPGQHSSPWLYLSYEPSFLEVDAKNVSLGIGPFYIYFAFDFSLRHWKPHRLTRRPTRVKNWAEWNMRIHKMPEDEAWANAQKKDWI